MFDGAVRKSGIYKDIVLINDIGISHFDSLTVFDYLYYGARLRLTHGVIECRERARQAARLVGLEGSTTIGKLSKSAVRILSVAAELVGNPTLICLIDPTEGLDAGGAMDVMRVLHTVAKRVSMATTIVYNVFSIHEDMLRLMDSVALMVGSRLEHLCVLKSFPGRAMNTASNLITQASVVVIDHERNHSFAQHKSDLVEVSAAHANSMAKIVDDLNRLTAESPTHPVDSKVSPINGRSLAPTSPEQGIGSPKSRSLHLLSQQQHAGSEYVAFPEEGSSSGGGGTRNQRGRSEDHFSSSSRRLGEPGLPIRYHKSLFQEFAILFLRSLAFHWKNVSAASLSALL